MKQVTILLVVTLLHVRFGFSQTSSENYVTTHTARVPITGSLPSVTDHTQVQRSTQYFDGLGRPVQSVSHQASPSGSDIISFQKYDDYGRVDKTYLPYAHSSQANGNFIDPVAALSEQQSFYTTKTGNGNDGQNAFSKPVYEPSPLNRVLKQLPPGQSWAGSDCGVTYQYQVNSLDDEVILFEETEDGFQVSEGYFYPENELYKNITEDENGNEIREYVDKLGRIVLKEVESGDNDYPFYRTYYIYDDFGLLQYVLPPTASKIIESAGEDSGENWIYIGEDTEIDQSALEGKSFPLTIWVKPGVKLDITDPFTVSAINDGDLFVKFGIPPNSPQAVLEMAYQYQYDERQRMIAKKVPDAGWVYMVYDRWDRLVLTQDANQREIDQWTFTSHDVLNRPVMTGFITDSRNQEDLQTYVMGLTNRFVTYDGTGAHGYDTGGYPFIEVAPDTILSVIYYDNYAFLDMTGWEAGFDFEAELSVLSEDVLKPVKGQVTGGKQLILGTDTYLNSTTYYDHKYRPVQSVFHDPQLNITRTTNEYDFIGNLTASKTTYSGLFEKSVYQWMEYDHMNRLKKTEMQIGEDASNRFTLTENNYNEIGELIEKNFNVDAETALQSLDYRHNIRGWLTHINRPDLSSDGSDEYESTDVFGMELMYDNAPGEAAQYNGNIGQINWKQAYGSVTSNYQYSYDPLNRLKSANYGEANAFSLNKFDVSITDYDANGNILGLTRKGDLGADLDMLSYTYYAGSNRLKAVRDDGDKANGFKDGITEDVEYTYDENGNMITDDNKAITHIEYNHLNLAKVIGLEDGTHIEYSYLADGTKLAKRVTKDGETIERLYQNGLVFENGVLDHILTGEGKVAPFIPGNDELLDYQYFITDHLGNVRSVVREPRVYEYLATMETANADIEEEQFSNLPQTRQTDVAESYTGDEFSVTSNAMPLGPAFALNVTKGDVVDLSVFGKVKTGEGQNEVVGTEAIIAALVDALTNQSITIGESASTLSTGLAEGLGLLGMVGSTNAEATGYLNYLLFDEHFSLITGGFDLVTATGYQELTLSDITIDQPGYLIAWLSYESTASDRVFFDDFRITLETSTVIQQEDYYPFGLTFNSYTKPGTIDQKYKYNGKELQEETGWHDYGARMYMADLGRFSVIDPMTDFFPSYTPYNYAQNNPIRFVDFNGLGPGDRVMNAKKAVQSDLRTYKQVTGETRYTDSYVDCSEFCREIALKEGYDPGSWSGAQAEYYQKHGEWVSDINDVRYGDFAFWKMKGSTDVTHTGLVIGKDENGRLTIAQSTTNGGGKSLNDNQKTNQQGTLWNGVMLGTKDITSTFYGAGRPLGESDTPSLADKISYLGSKVDQLAAKMEKRLSQGKDVSMLKSRISANENLLEIYKSINEILNDNDKENE